jgi:predicted metal-dependent hydrolase
VTEKETIQFEQWSIEVHRRSFRRSVSIYLYPRKPIKVIAAKNTTHKTILEFLNQKKDWIKKNLEKFSELQERFPLKKIKSLEKFPFLGVHRDLKVVITLNPRPFVSMTEDNLLLHIPRDEWSAQTVIDEHPSALKHLRDFYKREAISYLERQVEYWSQEMKLFPAKLKFREQRTRWGSCSSKKVINLNWRLIVFSPEIIDYVVVHELAHLRHMNHSKLFWDLVGNHVKDYRPQVQRLKESQFLVEFLGEVS